MIIKSIELTNIRSHTKTLINFPQGITAISGDIGCGKSTIFIALEFALFGFKKGEIQGEVLLRNGEDKGEILVSLEDKNKKITQIYRKISRVRKTGKVVQSNGYIKTNGNLFECSPKEMNSFIVDLLKFPKSFVSRNKNLVYRHTIYTPQEQLQEVIQSSSNNRLELLRKVFYIDKYNQLQECSKFLISEIREEKFYIKAKLEEKIPNSEKIEESTEKIKEISQKEKTQEKRRDELKKHLKKLEELFEKLETKEEIIEKKYIQLKEENQTKKEIRSQIQALKAKIDSHTKEVGNIKKKLKRTSLQEIRERLHEIKKKKDELLEKYLKQKKLLEKKAILEKRIYTYTYNQKQWKKQVDSLRISQMTKDIKNLKKEEEKVTNKARKSEAKCFKIKKQINNLKENSTKKEIYTANLKLKKKELEHMKDHKICPLCSQSVNRQTYRVAKQQAKKTLKNYSDKLTELENLTEQKDKIKEKYIKEEEKLHTEKEKVQVLKSKILHLRRELRRERDLEGKLKDEERKLFSGKFSKDLEQKEKIQKYLKENNSTEKIEQFKKQERQLEIIERKFQDIQSKSHSIEELKNELETLKNKIETKPNIVEKLQKVKEKLTQIKSKKTELKSKEKLIQIHFQNTSLNLEKIRTEKVFLEREVKDLKSKNKKLEQLEKKLEQKLQKEHFLTSTLPQVLQCIETQRFTSLFIEMDSHIKKYFKQLLDNEDIEVRLDEFFSPILEQNGYDTHIRNLSGGESSSLALAYRLALKSTIENNFLGQLGLNTLILDEPTYGFSSEQIHILGRLLTEISTRQIIVISHEREVNSIADTQISIEKTHNTSKIIQNES